MQRLAWKCALFVLLMACGAWAEDAADQAAAIKSLMQRVDALEKEVRELRQQNEQLKIGAVEPQPAVTETTVAQPESSAPAVAGMHDHLNAHQPEAGESYPNLKLRGFGNVDYVSADSKSQPSGFVMGQFVMHFSSALSKKTSFFGELSFTAQQNNYSADVERAIIRYDMNDYLKVSFGRYHTPVNYWNTAFHHGAWLQTTISRPEMVRFGGRFLPIHFVGALAEGRIPSGGLGLNYNFGVGNGRQTISLLSRDGDAGDVNSNRAFVASVFARPAGLYGLQVGASMYRDKVSVDVANPVQSHYREWITSGHIVYEKESPEVLLEFANVRHRDLLSNQVWDSQAAYAQFAYRLPGVAKKFKPYYRYEYIHAPVGEPVLGVPNLKGGQTVGTRYDITDFAAFKAEYRHWNRTQNEKFQGFWAQTAFTF
ncbi:MAG TPA: bZIP transcription factor [Terriglobales bacterium]|nr:bZIP transcription factor [Terriglobales bacterium]